MPIPSQKDLLVALALGRILRMGSRPTLPGDIEEYERCRDIIMRICSRKFSPDDGKASQSSGTKSGPRRDGGAEWLNKNKKGISWNCGEDRADRNNANPLSCEVDRSRTTHLTEWDLSSSQACSTV